MMKEYNSIDGGPLGFSVIPSRWWDIDYGADLEGMKSEELGNP